MPAIVLVGAQWGDEGKGKATDLLGVVGRLRREVQRRQQRRPHHRRRRREVRAAPAALRDPHAGRHAGDRQRRRHRPRGAVRRDRRAARRAASTPRGCSSAPTRTSSARTTAPSTRSPSGSSATRKLGTTGRGIGPTYADKMSRVGVRVQDLFDEKILRQKVEGALEQKNHLLVKVYNRRAITVDEVAEEFLSYAERLRPMVADTVAACWAEALDARRAPCCSRAARRPCSTSTTAPIRSSRRPTRPPAAPAPARASRRPASTGSSRSSRPTRPGSAPVRSRPSCSTRTASGCAPTARSSARRPAGRAAAAGTTRSSRATRPASTASPTSS